MVKLARSSDELRGAETGGNTLQSRARDIMFTLRIAASRAATLIISSSSFASRNSVGRVSVSRVAIRTPTSQSFSSFRSRFASQQEQAATSETTDAITESDETVGSAAEPIQHDQAEAATSETTDALTANGTNTFASHHPITGATLYIGNLSFDTSEQDLERHFGQFGKTTNLKLVTHPDGRSRGFAFVTFTTIEEAQAAIKASDAIEFQGRAMRARLADQFSSKQRVKNQNRTPTSSLYIGNLSFDLTDSQLNDIFRDVKNVTDVRVAIDRRTGQPRGFAHADFTDVASAESAKEALQGKSVAGRELRLDFASGVKQQ